MSEKRDCYHQCFQSIMTGGEREFGSWVLVHGYPRLTRDDGDAKAGTKYGHAWLESPDGLLVCDVVKDMIAPRAIYYLAGKIDESECQRFTKDEAAFKAVSTGHSGPWGDEPVDAVWHGTQGKGSGATRKFVSKNRTPRKKK